MGLKTYSSNEISNLPKQITYEKGGYIYTYVLTENSPPTFNGVELPNDDIITKDGQVISTKTYGYKLAYTNEPKISTGIIFVSPIEGAAEAKWEMSVGGGTINGRSYSQHAMERMAPNTPEVKAELYERATKLAQEKGLVPQTKGYSTFVDKYIDPRNIPPSVIEDAIKNAKPIPGNRPDTFLHETESVKVVVNGNGDVITVIPK
ncbi:hypothetical protein [Clostridium drakei]|uniref:Uncharacterized protein n=1 Tax=Clostridium drakei TaxID=332101 RepID=A0A2U8DMN1_9CLOT|nr:hypothetical protein [Clostridium drakei]AWI03454.1 hypothetical protein B9W14_02760 [Clostridium drakei]